VNVALKLLLMGPLAQVGLALATAVGAWINLLLVLWFAVRANHLEFDRDFVQSLAKFFGSGVVLALAFWLTRKLAATHLAATSAFRDETILLLLIGVGTVIYAASILLLFGPRWLRSLMRG